MKKIICIVGPTGSGKTKLSIKLAKYLNAEIINGDAVSIYKKLDIGSAKIRKDEMSGIPHHLVSHIDLDTNYTVYNFQKEARALIKTIKVPLIVGGSGLYIQAALYDYNFENQTKLSYPSVDEMLDVIYKNDPNIKIDIHNERRIESAYRQVMHGQKRSLKQNKHQPLYDIFLIYLDMDRNILKKRLETRLDQMIEQGFIEETKALLTYPLNIIGYRELKNYLQGHYDLETAKNEIITKTMRFAKRQKTWFLNQMKPHIYDALSPTLFDDIKKDIDQFLGDAV